MATPIEALQGPMVGHKFSSSATTSSAFLAWCLGSAWLGFLHKLKAKQFIKVQFMIRLSIPFLSFISFDRDFYGWRCMIAKLKRPFSPQLNPWLSGVEPSNETRRAPVQQENIPTTTLRRTSATLITIQKSIFLRGSIADHNAFWEVQLLAMSLWRELPATLSDSHKFKCRAYHVVTSKTRKSFWLGFRKPFVYGCWNAVWYVPCMLPAVSAPCKRRSWQEQDHGQCLFVAS